MKQKLHNEIVALQKQVAETDGMRVELKELREEMAERDKERDQLEQWKQDFQEGAKHMNKMKFETQEAKDLAIAYKRKLRESELKSGGLEAEVKRLKDSLRIAEAVRDGAQKKMRENDKSVRKMQQHVHVHDTLRVGAEEELRSTKQFLDQERSFRLQDLHRHNELMETNEAMNDVKAKLTREKVKVVKEVVGQRARVRKLQSELEASKLITAVADQDIGAQHREIAQLRMDVLELKRVIQEKNREIGVWARRFMELEGEYHRVQHDLSRVALGASQRSMIATRGPLAQHGAAATAAALARSSASLTQADLDGMGLPRPTSLRTGTAASRRRQRVKTPLAPEPDFLTRRADGPDAGAGRPQTVSPGVMNPHEFARSGRPTPVIMKQKYFSGTGTGPHKSGTVPSLGARTTAANAGGSRNSTREESSAYEYTEHHQHSGDEDDSEYGGTAAAKSTRRLLQTGSTFTGRGLGLRKSDGASFVGSSGSSRQMIQRVLSGLPQMPVVK